MQSMMRVVLVLAGVGLVACESPPKKYETPKQQEDVRNLIFPSGTSLNRILAIADGQLGQEVSKRKEFLEKIESPDWVTMGKNAIMISSSGHPDALPPRDIVIQYDKRGYDKEFDIYRNSDGVRTVHAFFHHGSRRNLVLAGVPDMGIFYRRNYKQKGDYFKDKMVRSMTEHDSGYTSVDSCEFVKFVSPEDCGQSALGSMRMYKCNWASMYKSSSSSRQSYSGSGWWFADSESKLVRPDLCPKYYSGKDRISVRRL